MQKKPNLQKVVPNFRDMSRRWSKRAAIIWSDGQKPDTRPVDEDKTAKEVKVPVIGYNFLADGRVYPTLKFSQ